MDVMMNDVVRIRMTSDLVVAALIDGFDPRLVEDASKTKPALAWRPDAIDADIMTIGFDARHREYVPAEAVMLAEAEDSHEQSIERFTQGNCAAFAHALWLLHGRRPDVQVGVLTDDGGDLHSEDFPHCHVHVYLDLPDAEYDVHGRRTPAEMAEDLELVSWDLLGPFGAEEFRRIYTGRGDEPLYCDDDDVARAIVLIRRNPARYGL